MASYPCPRPATQFLSVDQAHKVLSNAGFAASQLELMTAIGRAESNLGIDVIGDCNLPAPRVGYHSFGAWQILQSPADQDNTAQISDLLTAQGNANAAYSIYKSQGYRAWSTYNNNAYKKYMGSGASLPSGDLGGQFGGNLSPGLDSSNRAPGVGSQGSAIPGAGIAAAAAKALGAVDLEHFFGYVVKAGAWLADRHNWLRVIEIVAGLAAIFVGVIIVSRDALGKGAAIGALAA